MEEVVVVVVGAEVKDYAGHLHHVESAQAGQLHGDELLHHVHGMRYMSGMACFL
jgi:hypothetical protein